MSETDSNFDQIYETELLESLKNLEVFRKKTRIQILIQGLIGLTFLILFVVFIVQDNNELFAYLLLPALFFLGFSWATASITGRKLRLQFKEKVIFPILKDISDNVKYFPERKVKNNILNKSLLFKSHIVDNIGNDYIKFTIENKIVQFFEIKVYKYFGFKVFFSGIFMMATFNKAFKTKTVVLPETKSDLLERIKLKFNRQMKNPRIIGLEDPDFEKKFIVIGEDQVESRYLLSTSLMQRLYDYDEKYKGVGAFSFIDNNLYVSIPMKNDLFEPRYYKSNIDKEFIKSYYNYFRLFTDVIKELDLNNKIWL